jgi:ABC-type sugar transport system substrate-binding protein
MEPGSEALLAAAAAARAAAAVRRVRAAAAVTILINVPTAGSEWRRQASTRKCRNHVLLPEAKRADSSLRIPTKANTDSEGKANGIPGRKSRARHTL